MKKELFVALFPILLASTAGAQTKNVSATIKGTLNSPVTGTCPTGYANQCFSGNCQMSTPTADATVSGSFGKGTVTGLCFTGDVGINVNAPSNTDGSATCSPFFGTGVVSATKKGVLTNTTLNLAGVLCVHQAKKPKNSIEGGFGIAGSDVDPAETGWGTATGTVLKSSGAFSIKLSGSSTP